MAREVAEAKKEIERLADAKKKARQRRERERERER